MPHLIRYQCQPEFLPVIEEALTVHGCNLDLQTSDQRQSCKVMTDGSAQILLSQVAHNPVATIEVWGIAGPLIARLLESLPLRLHRQTIPTSL